MDYVFDVALLFISGCAAAYCWTLNQRLKSLQNLKKGVGHAMVNLTRSVTAVENNAQKLHREATAAVAELNLMLRQVGDCERQVDILLETLERQSRETVKSFEQRADDAETRVSGASAELKELVRDAKKICLVMNEHLIRLAERQKAARHDGTNRAEAAMPREAASAPIVTPVPTEPVAGTVSTASEPAVPGGATDKDLAEARVAAARLRALAEKDNEIARRLAQRLAKPGTRRLADAAAPVHADVVELLNADRTAAARREAEPDRLPVNPFLAQAQKRVGA